MLNTKNKKARIREAKRIKYLQHLEDIKDTAKIVWYGADYTHEGYRYYKARAKSFGLSWREAWYWESYWRYQRCTAIPDKTIFDYNPTPEEIIYTTGTCRQLGKVTKEEYCEIHFNDFCQGKYFIKTYPWLMITSHLARLWQYRGDKQKSRMYYSQIPQTITVGGRHYHLNYLKPITL